MPAIQLAPYGGNKSTSRRKRINDQCSALDRLQILKARTRVGLGGDDLDIERKKHYGD